MLFQSLLVAHVVCATAGYSGLIAVNLWLFVLSRTQRAEALIQGIDIWRRVVRIVGPLTGIGVLVGFGLAAVAHVPLASEWLVATYAAIIVVLAAQAAIMIPWQVRAQSAIAQGARVSTAPAALTLALFSAGYIAIVSLMLLR